MTPVPSGAFPADPPSAPDARAWLAAHALDRGEALAPWWLAALGPIRTAAAELEREPDAASGDPGSWREFQRPFAAAAESLGLIRDPIAAIAWEGLGAAQAPADLSGEMRPAAPGKGAQASVSEAPQGIGAVKSKAKGATQGKARSGGPGAARKPDGTWVETGNPTFGAEAERKPAFKPLPFPGIRPGPSGRDAKQAALGGQEPASLDALFSGWRKRAGKRLREYGPAALTVGMGLSDGIGFGRPAPLPFPDNADTALRFRELLAHGLTGGHSPASGRSLFPEGNPDATPGSDAAIGMPESADPRSPKGKDKWNGLADALFPSGQTRSDGKDPRPASRRNPAGAIPAEAPHRSPAAESGPAAGQAGRLSASTAEDRDPRGPGAGPSARKPAEGGMEWMDEEEDLAAKLHRLLRRQAQRRGVDLS